MCVGGVGKKGFRYTLQGCGGGGGSCVRVQGWVKNDLGTLYKAVGGHVCVCVCVCG